MSDLFGREEKSGALGAAGAPSRFVVELVATTLGGGGPFSLVLRVDVTEVLFLLLEGVSPRPIDKNCDELNEEVSGGVADEFWFKLATSTITCQIRSSYWKLTCNVY